jgi:hypothetical protein
LPPSAADLVLFVELRSTGFFFFCGQKKKQKNPRSGDASAHRVHHLLRCNPQGLSIINVLHVMKKDHQQPTKSHPTEDCGRFASLGTHPLQHQGRETKVLSPTLLCG